MINFFIDAFLKKIAQVFVDEFFDYADNLIKIQETEHLRANQVSGQSILRLDNVSIDIKNKILEYHHNFRSMIAAAADRMENRQFAKSGISKNRIYLTGHEKDRALQIVDNRRILNLSFQTLHALLQMFIQMNERLKSEIISANNSNSEYTKRLKNGVLVYELLDFTYNYINDFRLVARDRLRDIKESIKKDLDDEEREDLILKSKLSDKTLKESAVKNINKRIEDRRKIRSYVIKEWNEFETKMDDTDKQISAIKAILSELDAYRLDAKNHIGSLTWAPLASIIADNISIVDELKNIDWNLLVDFNLEDLYRLTGKTTVNENK